MPDLPDAFRPVNPPGITGQESVADLIAQTFSAGTGRQFRDLCESFSRSVTNHHKIFMALSGIPTVAGYAQSSIIPLMQRGLVSALSVTNAIVYHDVQRWWPSVVEAIPLDLRLKARHPERPAMFEVDPRGNDEQNVREGVVRVYDVVFDEVDGLYVTDAIIQHVLNKMEPGEYSSAAFTEQLGKWMREREELLGIVPLQSRSLVVHGYVHGIPIYQGAFWDGSIGLNVVLHNVQQPERRVIVSGERDVNEFASLMHLLVKGGHHLTLVIMGGGVPKNYALQIGPYLSQICHLGEQYRYDAELQVCDAFVDNMALSPAPASEALTWGKVNAEALPFSVYCRGDWAQLLPLFTRAAIDRQLWLRPAELNKARNAAMVILEGEIQRPK